MRTEVPHPSEWPMHTRPGPSVFGSSSRSSAVRRGTSLPAVFEKFTERAIKTVMLAQHEARQLGYFEVRYFFQSHDEVDTGCSRCRTQPVSITLDICTNAVCRAQFDAAVASSCCSKVLP